MNITSRFAPTFLVVCLLPAGITLSTSCSPGQPDIEGNEGEGEGEGEGERPSTGGSVAWSAELPNPYVFPGPDDEDGVLDPIGVDFFLQYTVELPTPDDPPSSLTIEICMKRAGEAEPTCSTETQQAAAATTGYRWGFDPSQYDTGLNVYEHTLRMEQAGFLVDEETLRFEVTAP
jgi:hypothetical protein